MQKSGVYISDGVNVQTAPADQYIFDTDHSALKMYKSGFVTVTTNGGGLGSLIVPHNFGFAPAFYGFRKWTARWDFMENGVEYPNSFFSIGDPNKWTKNDPVHHGITMCTDSTNLYIDIAGGLANTTYTFKYYLLADLAEAFNGAANLPQRSLNGIKVAKPGIDVRYAQPYQLGFCSDFKTFQFHDVNVRTATLTLPGYFASYRDQTRESGTYIDFMHGLGYPPFFLAFGSMNTFEVGEFQEVPFYGLNGADMFNLLVCGFCDANRVRISFWREAYFGYEPGTEIPLVQSQVYLKVFIFNEDLNSTYG